jgi:hypothetical protein
MVHPILCITSRPENFSVYGCQIITIWCFQGWKINVPALQIKEFLDIFLCFAKNEQQLTYCKARHFLRQKVTVTRICTFIDPSASNLWLCAAAKFPQIVTKSFFPAAILGQLNFGPKCQARPRDLVSLLH